MRLTFVACVGGWLAALALSGARLRPLSRGTAPADDAQLADGRERSMSSGTAGPARSATELATLARVAATASPSGPRQQQLSLERLLRHARGVLGATRICVLARTPKRPRSAALIADAGGGFAARRVQTDGRAVELALDSGRLVVVPTRGRAGGPAPSSGETGWAAVAPIPDGRGALLAQWEGRVEVEPLDLDVLCELASFTGRALCHRARDGFEPYAPAAQIRGLLDALADVDSATCEHSLETGRLAVRIGKALGLDRADLGELELGALLHDVGKLCVPTEILVKPGPLDDEEWRLMRRHPRLGADIVAAIPGLEAVALIVLLHHERPDGEGYPYGLIRARVPLASRIVSVCDAYGAMTSGRPYRAQLDGREAVEELRRRQGSQFDARVVDSLASVVHHESLLMA